MLIDIYGGNMQGKSTFANQFPDAFFISTDGNAKFITDNYIDVKNFKEFNSAIKEHMGKHEWLVIDTMNMVLEWERRDILKSKNIEYEGDANDMGKTFYTVKQAQLKLMDMLVNHTDQNIIMLWHEIEVVEKDEFGQDVTVFQPDVTNKKITGQLLASATFIGRAMRSSDGKYTIDFGTSPLYQYTGGRSRTKLRDSIPNSYEAFVKNFGLEKILKTQKNPEQ